MADPIKFPECNAVLYGGSPDVQDLHTHMDQTTMTRTSCWKLTPEELQDINAHGVIWLQVRGPSIPPMLVLGVKPLEKRAAPSLVNIYTK